MPDQRTIDAIVGSAIRALVESGAEDAVIGSFAANHRAKVVALLGQTEEEQPQPVDLENVVTNAVRLALREAGIDDRRRKKQTPARRIPVLINGHRTSVTIRAELVERLVQSRGGEATAAKAVIQDIASSVPADTENRSGWISERIEALVSFPGWNEDGANGNAH